MNASDFLPLSPLVVVAAGSVLILLALCVRRSHSLTAMLTALALATGLGLVALSARKVLAMPYAITPLLWVDGLTLLFLGLMLSAALAVAVLMYGYGERTKMDRPEEMYVLLLLATLGACVLVCSCHFASFFLGLELLSVSLYSMIAYSRRELGLEAGVKYLVLAATSAAVLLFGMALVYSQTGTMRWFALWELKTAAHLGQALGLCGLGMIAIGAGFKLALAPMHLWTPDVYQGAPAPVTAFVATASKGAVLAVLLRLMHALNFQQDAALVTLLTAAAMASMVAGNLLALMQRSVKRLLAYSSIANLGYVMVAFMAGGTSVPISVGYFLAAYFAAMIGALAVVSALSGSEGEADDLAEYRGLAWRRPWMAAALAAMMLSLAGIPLTAGFVGKFLVLWAGVGSQLWLLSMTLVAGSAVGLFYYLRVVAALLARPEARGEGRVESPAAGVPASIAAVMGVATALLVALGVWPGPLMNLIGALLNGRS